MGDSKVLQIHHLHNNSFVGVSCCSGIGYGHIGMDRIVEVIGFGRVKRNISLNILLGLCQNLAAEKCGKLCGVSEA